MSPPTRNEDAQLSNDIGFWCNQSEQLFREDKSSLGNKRTKGYSDDSVFSRNDPKWICKCNSEIGLLVFRIYCKLFINTMQRRY